MEAETCFWHKNRIIRAKLVSSSIPSVLVSANVVVIHHFACRSLSIGSWRRVGQNAMDLITFFSPDKGCMTYYIHNDSAGYKIEYPFSFIKSISLEQGDMSLNAQGNAGQKQSGGLVVELTRPPLFYMDSAGTGGFYQCGDFTEDQQASHIMTHYLGGHPKVLSGQLAKLASLEAFQNRFAQFPMEYPVLSASAPVSPQNRPASTTGMPNHHAGSMFPPEIPFNHGLHPGRGAHKRTRSRSVPIAIDVSMLHQSMPSFNFQHEPMHNMNHNMQENNFYAPIPQYQGGSNPNLRIDTSNGYGMDYRQYPLSAATTTSPSDYASPGLFSTSTQMDNVPASTYNTNFNMPFLSPMPESSTLTGPSPSPLSMMRHGDPVIASQSPPLTSIHRSASADMFMSHDHNDLSDEGLTLSDMYAKQNLNLPMHSPNVEGPSDEMDMNQMVSFTSLDQSLSPAPEGM
jgi:hypothetical protein